MYHKSVKSLTRQVDVCVCSQLRLFTIYLCVCVCMCVCVCAYVHTQMIVYVHMHVYSHRGQRWLSGAIHYCFALYLSYLTEPEAHWLPVPARWWAAETTVLGLGICATKSGFYEGVKELNSGICASIMGILPMEPKNLFC